MQSQVPGERLSPTQPFPTRPAPYDLQGLLEDELIDFTPELRQRALDELDGILTGPLFLPPIHRDNDLVSERGTPIEGAYWCPGSSGGTNITGPPAADPETGVIYVISQKGCSGNVLIPGAESMVHPDNATTGTTVVDWSVVGGGSVRPSVDGLPIFKPPYGRVTAIDLNTGEHLWWIPRGDTPQNILDRLAELGVTDVPNTGRGGGGSVMVTPSLLLMSGQGSDGTPWLYAIDKATGERLGQVELPANSQYGMMSYQHEGVQYIVVQVPGSVTALRLPAPSPS